MKTIRWPRVVGGLAVAAALSTGLVAVPATPASAALTYYALVARHSWKCLDVTDNSQSNGAKLQQYGCHYGPNQQWRLEYYTSYAGDDYYRVRVASTGKCVDIEDASQADRARAQQYSCHSGWNQQFRRVNLGGGFFAYVARHSGKCLDVEADSTANNAKVWQYTCDYGYNQQWALF